uniref:non-specific serine/threonine protein kinase n=2 Tax=Schistocephalus solidus TaxID=70667 RepID=A0A0X3PVM6_SCHSO
MVTNNIHYSFANESALTVKFFSNTATEEHSSHPSVMVTESSCPPSTSCLTLNMSPFHEKSQNNLQNEVTKPVRCLQAPPSASTCRAQPTQKIGTYVLEKTIGKGNFSVVKLARHTITQIKVAIKIIDKTRLSTENLEKAQREVEILKTIQHPNIIKLYQVMQTAKLLCIVTEYLPNGELFEYIANNGRLTEQVARYKFAEILSAVEHCHRNNIVHRDLKAENVLLDQSMTVKLADFGFGTFQPEGGNSLLTTWCGSPPYAAPEIFKGEPYIGTKADVWSLGVLLYVLVVGVLPFGAHELPKLRDQVLAGNFRVPFWLSSPCEELLRAMLSKSPNRRPSISQIYRFKWLANLDSYPLLREPTPPIPEHLLPFMPFAAPATSGADLLCAPPTTNVRHPRVSLVYPSGLNLAAEMKIGKLNHLVIQVMESNGMNRQLILESLGRCAYDHLTATYLLLGERLRSTRHSLPHTLTSRPTEISVLVEASLADRGQSSQKQQKPEYGIAETLDQTVPRSSCPNGGVATVPSIRQSFGVVKAADLMHLNVIFPPKLPDPRRHPNCVSLGQGVTEALNQAGPLPRLYEPSKPILEDNFDSLPLGCIEDSTMASQTTRFSLIGHRVEPARKSVGCGRSPGSQSPINLSCRNEPTPSSSSSNQNADSFEGWFPDQSDMMSSFDASNQRSPLSYATVDRPSSPSGELSAFKPAPPWSLVNRPMSCYNPLRSYDSPITLPHPGELDPTYGQQGYLPPPRQPAVSPERKISHDGNYGFDWSYPSQQLYPRAFPPTSNSGISVTDEYTFDMDSCVEADSRHSSFSNPPGPQSAMRYELLEMDGCASDDTGIDIPTPHSQLFSASSPPCSSQLSRNFYNPPAFVQLPQLVETAVGQLPTSSSQAQATADFSTTPDYFRTIASTSPQAPIIPECPPRVAHRKFGVYGRPPGLFEHIKRYQQMHPSEYEEESCQNQQQST